MATGVAISCQTAELSYTLHCSLIGTRAIHRQCLLVTSLPISASKLTWGRQRQRCLARRWRLRIAVRRRGCDIDAVCAHDSKL